MKTKVAYLAAVVLLAIATVPLGAYLKFGTRIGDRNLTIRWSDFPVRYFVTDRGVDGVSAQQFQQTIARAFATWDAVEGTDTSAEFAGFTQASPFEDDGVNVLGYLSRPEMDRVLGATTFLIDVVDGAIVESDIFFNSAFPWSTSQSGTTGRFDLESIAVHEIGHLLGLSHSAMGETEVRPGGRRVLASEAVMFPIAFSPGSIDDRELKADDIAGLVDVYGGSSQDTGSISGRVTKNGAGVQGAHVVAFNPQTGDLIGGFTLSSDGSFVIAGLQPGPHILRAEPLDDADLESFFEGSFEVDLDFQPAFHDRVVVVPRGGGTSGVEIRVNPK